MIFALLGGLLIWAGLSSRFFFDPRKPAWLLLGAALVFWGAWAWVKTKPVARTAERTSVRLGGASLIVVGLAMLTLWLVPFRLAGTVVAATGGVFVLRGLIGAALAFRTD